MVGGIIDDYFIKETRQESYIVMFLVKENKDYCTVMAEIPKPAIDTNLIKAGLHIWWHNPSVLIKIEETTDVPFKKIGFSGGDDNTFKADRKAFELIK